MFGSLSPGTDYVCFAAATYDDSGTTQYKCSGPSPVATTEALFYLDVNGVTVKCPNAQVGTSGDVTIGGVTTTFTKRSEATLRSLIAVNDFAPLPTTCTSGVTSMFQVRAVLDGRSAAADPQSPHAHPTYFRPRQFFFNKATFNEDISTWDTSDVETTRNMVRCEKMQRSTLPPPRSRTPPFDILTVL